MDIFSYKLGQKRGGGSGGGGSVRLQNKTFNANGTYKADAGYDGLGTVTVNVAGSGGIAAGVSYDELNSSGQIVKATIYGDAVPRTAFYENFALLQVTLPEGLTCVHYGAFYSCRNLELTRLPDSVTHIKERAFYGCTATKIEKIPQNVQIIEVGGFTGNSVETVTFEGTPTSVTNCFGGCSKLTVINVPWAEGEVEGAPWGATNATINYNYTGA